MKNLSTLKRCLSFILLLILMLTNAAQAQDNGGWNTQPEITEVYEQDSGKIYMEWDGKASSYLVYVDGKQVQSVNVPSALIDLKKGVHTIKIVPFTKEKGSDINVEVSGLGVGIALGGFSTAGTTTGTPSKPFSFDYTPNPLINSALTVPRAKMSIDNTIHLTFTDKYNADEYLITVKDGNDTSYIRFFPRDDTQDEFMSFSGSDVTVSLDPIYLRENGCMQIQLGKKYSFIVQLRKSITSKLSGEKISSVIHDSKESKELWFVPVAAWSIAPVIAIAKQTGEGQLLLQWTHDLDINIPCEYDVLLASKVLIVKTGETIVATTTDKEIVLLDLADGNYSYAIVPRFEGKKGTASAEANVTIKNTWNAEPKLILTQVEENQVKLEWTSALGIETYNIRVYVGNSKSFLKFVDLDYKEYMKFDVPVTGDMLSTVFTYDDVIDSKNEVKLKFDIQGIKHAENGVELTTKVGSQSITLKPDL